MIAIRDLADCIESVEQIAEWQWSEWGPFADDGTLDGLRKRLSSWTNMRGVPNIFVAFDGEAGLGSVALVAHDMVEPELRFATLNPWLSGLLVNPDMRRRGVGAALVAACERRAALLGFTELYLYTSTAEAFYERLGWQTIAEAAYEGASVAVMRRRLDPT